jgi:hypothetical protein
MKSIIQKEKECYFCKTTENLHLHHIFFGANRAISDKNGFTVYLCAYHHNMSNESVHMNRELDLLLKKYTQMRYERKHTRDEFIKLIGKSYI